MTPELGQIALALALCMSAILAIVPLMGSYRGNQRWMALGPAAALSQLLFVGFAFVLLTYAFVSQDFSVVYVATNSNLALPMIYRISAVWGAHEGSMLLWALVLCLWTYAAAYFQRDLPAQFRARMLSTLGVVCLGFISFLIFTSNPFARHAIPLADGGDLNPLLQDPGLIIHPPMLYMGYVGMAVPFAFAIATLLNGQLDQRCIRAARPWTNIAWAFLTVGIALGSWWAYYELGWGGWWFWDPVENASFMPWLLGAALIHCQAITEKRGSYINWTLFLSIAAFSLSLLGTFLVRSGVLTSVHSFASDPLRGGYILAMLAVVVGGALTLFAWNAGKFKDRNESALMSKETLLLVNNIALFTAMIFVLGATLFPIFADSVFNIKYSAGEPLYSQVFPFFALIIMLVVPLGAFCRWQADSLASVTRDLRLSMIAALILGGFAAVIIGGLSIKAIIGLLLAHWVIIGTLAFVIRRWRRPGTNRFSAEMLGMITAHLGLGVWALGVVLTNSLSIERDVRMQPGVEVDMSGYKLKMIDVEDHQGPNYQAIQGIFELYRNGKLITTLRPQKRFYKQGNPMTEAAILPGLFADAYVALGDQVDASSKAWAVRAYHKPFIRFIWLGGLLMALGGIIAACERRLREPARETLSTTTSNAKNAGQTNNTNPGDTNTGNSNTGDTNTGEALT